MSTSTLVKKSVQAERSSIVRILSRAIQALIIAWIAFPAVPSPVGTGLDNSWIWGLNMAHVLRLHFGTQVIFTYGPLGYLAFPTFPEAEPWAVLAFGWGVGALIAYGLWQLVRFSSMALGWLHLVLFCSASITLLAVPTQSLERVTIAAFAMAMGVSARTNASRPTKPWLDLGILYVLAVVGMLTKLNLAAAPFLLAAFFTAYQLARVPAGSKRPWKPALLCALVFPVTFAALFCVSGGNLRDTFAYLQSSREIVSGYSDAMAMAGPLWIIVAAVISYVSLFLIFPAISGDFRVMAMAVPPLAIVALSTFKSDMVREDGHVVPFQFLLALIALFLASIATRFRGRVIACAFCVASIVVGNAVQRYVWPQIAFPIMDEFKASALLGRAQLFLNWRKTVSDIAASSEQQIQQARVPANIAALAYGKSVTTLPFQIDEIRAGHFRWRPLPVFQSYSAYTPKLDRMNADQLRAEDAPEAVLLSWTPIDGHPFFFESPEAAREVLNRYDLKLESPAVDLLERRNSPRFDAPQPAGETVAHWNQVIPLPAVGEGEILLMQTDMNETLKGLLWRQLLRAPAIYVYPSLATGKEVSGRVLRMTMPDGVLISEWPRNLQEAAPLFFGRRVDLENRVVSLLFKPDDPSSLRSTFSIRWYRQKLRPAT